MIKILGKFTFCFIAFLVGIIFADFMDGRNCELKGEVVSVFFGTYTCERINNDR